MNLWRIIITNLLLATEASKVIEFYTETRTSNVSGSYIHKESVNLLECALLCHVNAHTCIRFVYTPSYVQNMVQLPSSCFLFTFWPFIPLQDSPLEIQHTEYRLKSVCPQDFDFLLDTEMCLHFLPSLNMTFEDSVAYCRSRFSRVLQIYGGKKAKAWADYLFSSKGYTGDGIVWAGAKRTAMMNYTWSWWPYKNTTIFSQYVPWSADAPLEDSTLNCVEFHPSLAHITNTHCSKLNGVICQKRAHQN